jgi:hypothetical protein
MFLAPEGDWVVDWDSTIFLTVVSFCVVLIIAALIVPVHIEQVVDPEDTSAADEWRRERKRLSENHYVRSQNLVAWLLATLVAVNGAGALNFIRAHSPAASATFVLGVILAIGSGFAAQHESQARSELHFYESQAKIKPAAKRRKARMRLFPWRLRRLAALLNYLSLAAFIAGCLISTA